MSEIESIDEVKDKLGAYDKLLNDVLSYLNDDVPDPKDRLRIERAMSKYAEQNSSDWLLNIIIAIDRARRGA